MKLTENTFTTIGNNIRERRRHLRLTQELLAQKADLSVDTIKNVEGGRRSMRLDTYLRIVCALGTTPAALLGEEMPKEYADRLIFMSGGRSENEMQFILHVVEQTLKAEELYIKG